jgi:PAS domain S-box-containing protein
MRLYFGLVGGLGLASVLAGLTLVLVRGVAALHAVATSAALLGAGLVLLTIGLVRLQGVYRRYLARVELAGELSETFKNELGNRAYGLAATVFERYFRCSHVAFGWIDTWNTLAWVHPGEDRPHLMSREKWDAEWQEFFRLGAVVATGRGTCPVDGSAWNHGAALPVTLRTESLALVLLGRDGRAFSAGETRLMAEVVSDLVPVIYHRVQGIRQEAVRRMTEIAFHNSEARLRSILDESRDMVLTVNSFGQIAYINPAGASMLGYADPAQLIGRPARVLWLQVEEYDFISRCIRDQRYLQDVEVLFQDSAGGSHFCLLSATATQTGGGDFAEYTALVKDISDLIAGQKALTRANIELEETNRSLREAQAVMVRQEKLASAGRLAAGLAREISRPLALLGGNGATIVRTADLLAEFLAWLPGRGGDEIRDWVEARSLHRLLDELELAARESAEGSGRIAGLADGLRGFVRNEEAAGIEPLDVNLLVQGALSAVREELRGVVDVEQRLEALPLVFCHQSEIGQVIRNLLLNAAQAIRSRPDAATGGRILVRTWSDGAAMHCEVDDNGPGIPVADLDKVFDPFFTARPAGQGVELGLSVAYDIIVNRHGGRMAVESGKGEGARFVFSLPIAGNPRMG